MSTYFFEKKQIFSFSSCGILEVESEARCPMYYVYILRCADDTLYTGYTPDLTARLAAHNSGKGAKYTRGRHPVTLAFSEVFEDRHEALGYEYSLKQLSREEKLRLIAGQNDPADEYLTIYDRAGNPCGERPRTVCHRQGLRHAVVHLWCVQDTESGPVVWLQQRGFDRPLYPGLFDLTATGHIDPGETPLDAILREAREEAGLHLSPADLTAVPPVLQQYDRPDGGFDNEIAHAFLYRTSEPPVFSPGPEVTRILPIPLHDLKALCEGAEEITLEGQDTPRTQFSCLHKSEWNKMKKLLK